MNKNDLHLLVQSKCHRVPLRATHEEITNPTGILAYEYSEIMKDMKEYEERYQYLKSLSIEEYDKETSLEEQKKFCEYQQKYHPDEVIYVQTHDCNDQQKT